MALVDTKYRLLEKFARGVIQTASGGAFGSPIPIYEVEMVAGPRAGAIHVNAGLGTGVLFKALSQNDCALLRQFIPWDFAGEPVAFMKGRWLRLEAGWPRALAETRIPLSRLPGNPQRLGYWKAGKNETGQVVVPGLSDRTPHWLFAGATGSGKTNALRGAAVQLAKQGAKLVLLDGKWGEGLRPLARLQGVIGPVATEASDIRKALGWVYLEMKRRYQAQGNGWPLLVVLFDEFQEFLGKRGDPLITETIRRIVAQGRAVHVHAILATQHPSLEIFGDPTIRRNVVGRIALRVADPKASEVAVGGPTPRADRLLGTGDAYCIAPGAAHRTQLALVTEKDIAEASGGEPGMREWEDFKAEELGMEIPQKGRPTARLSAKELAIALEMAYIGAGRPRLQDELEQAGLGRPGSDRADRLLRLARRTLKALRERGWDLVWEAEEDNSACLPENDVYEFGDESGE